MAREAAFRPASILYWTVLLPSILGFQLTSNSPYERHQPHSASSVITPRLSLSLPNQRLTRGIQLEAIWGSSSPKSSSSSDDDSADDEDAAENTPTDDAVVETSVSSADKSSDHTNKMESSTDSNEKSLLTLVNEIGNNFKTMAQRSTAKGYECEDQYKKIIFAAKACVYYTLFIFYRSYRGFFVLLPATFQRVYRNMEAAMNTGNLSLDEIGFSRNGEDVTSSSSKWRTKFTVSILTSVVTISYVVGGVLKMASKFLRTIAKTSDVAKSFGAAADEVMDFEGRISRVGKVNGEEEIETSGLTP